MNKARNAKTQIEPLYYLVLEGTKIYFVNNTPRTLNSVTSFHDLAEVQNGQGTSFFLFGPHTLHRHDRVLPQEAVLVADLDSIRDSEARYRLSLSAPYLRKKCISFAIPEFPNGASRHALLLPGDKRYKLRYTGDPEYMFLPAVERRT